MNYIFLAGSILLTAWLTLSFKAIDRWGINSRQAIVYNYITCVITGSIVQGGFVADHSLLGEPWLPWALFMGVLFITLFGLVAFIALRISVAVAAVAFKLSLIIPFVFSLVFYGEPATGLKIGGIVLALLAVILTFLPTAQNRKEKHPVVLWLRWLAPVMLFLGSGLLDTVIKYVEQEFIHPGNQNRYLITAFGTAAVTGIIVLLFLYGTGRERFSWKAVGAGLLIGIPNYFSIWCLIHALKGFTGNSSVIIPVNNMGIVLVSSLVAWLAFREQLSAINRAGIILSIGAIALIAYS